MYTLNASIEAEIVKISEIAGYLWQKGWSERNAGNISFDLTGFIEQERGDLSGFPYFEMDLPRGAAGLTLFVTGTGERLRDLSNFPERAGCILSIDDKARGYHILWGGESRPGFRPTSEFIAHLSIHLFNRDNGSLQKCVVHTHPVELIALSHHPSLGHSEEALNRALWSMLPEIRVYVPRGISLAPYALPGSKTLADITIRGLQSHDVVLWSKHGALATGKDAVEAFDYLDVANKGAIIYLKCLQAGYIPEGLTDEQMKGLEVFL